MPENDNGARRLLDILEKAQEVGHLAPLHGWATVFGITEKEGPVVNEDEEFEVARRLVQLHQLVIDVEVQLRSIEGLEIELYLEPFPRIRSVIKPSMLNSGQLGSPMKLISSSDITVLKFCATELSKHYAEPVVDEQLLLELRSQIDSLFDEVRASSLPKELKEFLLKHLETVRRAIQEYRIRGVERLKEALEQLAGSVMVNENLLKASKESEAVTKFSRIFYGLVSIVTFASKVTPLIGPAATAIGLFLPADPDAIPAIDAK